MIFIIFVINTNGDDVKKDNCAVRVCVFACVCVDLAEQIVETRDFFLQVFGLDDELVADGLGFPFRVKGEDQLHGEPDKDKDLLTGRQVGLKD